MANEMDTNRIMWNTNEGKRLPDLTRMNQEDLMDKVAARAVNQTIIDIVNESEIEIDRIRAMPLTMSGSGLVKFVNVQRPKEGNLHGLEGTRTSAKRIN
jgi:hypothetical protein